MEGFDRKDFKSPSVLVRKYKDEWMELTPQVLYSLIKAGKLAFVNVGRGSVPRFRISEASLVAYRDSVYAHVSPPTSGAADQQA